jgi:hypothetical protein
MAIQFGLKLKIKTNPVSLGLKNEKLESVSGTFLIFREPRVTKATTFICQKRKSRRNYVAIGTRQNLQSDSIKARSSCGVNLQERQAFLQ